MAVSIRRVVYRKLFILRSKWSANAALSTREPQRSLIGMLCRFDAGDRCSHDGSSEPRLLQVALPDGVRDLKL